MIDVFGGIGGGYGAQGKFHTDPVTGMSVGSGGGMSPVS